jgi:hypothetical protein
MNVLTDEETGECVNGKTDGGTKMDRWTDRCKDGQTDRWLDW